MATARAHVRALVPPGTVMALPTAPCIAPPLDMPDAEWDVFRTRVMRLTCIAGLSGSAADLHSRRHRRRLSGRVLPDRLGRWRRGAAGPRLQSLAVLRGRHGLAGTRAAVNGSNRDQVSAACTAPPPPAPRDAARPWPASGANSTRRRAMQVGLDRRGAGAEARAVDLQVLHDALDVVARLGERDALDPIDRVDLGIARIAVLRHPLLDPAAARIVAGKGQDVGAAVVLEQGGDLGGAHLRVVDRVGHETIPVVGHAEPLGGVAPGSGRDLHQPDRLGRRHVALIEAAFRAHDRIDDAAIELRSRPGCSSARRCPEKRTGPSASLAPAPSCRRAASPGHRCSVR